MFYLTTHSTHFIYGYMASDIWLRTILIVRKETRCRHIVYSYRLTARVLLYAPSHRQDNTYHGLCYTSRGALAGTRNSSMGPPHEGSIRRPIAPWANALPLSYVPLPASHTSDTLSRIHTLFLVTFYPETLEPVNITAINTHIGTAALTVGTLCYHTWDTGGAGMTVPPVYFCLSYFCQM